MEEKKGGYKRENTDGTSGSGKTTHGSHSGSDSTKKNTSGCDKHQKPKFPCSLYDSTDHATF